MMCTFKKIWRNANTRIFTVEVYKNYLLNLLGSFEIADIITPHITQLTIRLLEPIKIDYNFIEACDVFCFDIEGKNFIRNPKQLKGSPRAYAR